MTAPSGVAGVILAGGRSSRFAGGPKEEALLLGKPLIVHAIERAKGEVGRLAISRARAGAAEEFGLPVLADLCPDRGPLAGVHAGLVWAKSLEPGESSLATFAADTPFFPAGHVARLREAMGRSGAPAAIPMCGGEAHPTFGLWSIDLEPLARRRLEAGTSSLKGFAEAAGAVAVDFSDAGAAAFFNVNTAEDLEKLAAMTACRHMADR